MWRCESFSTASCTDSSATITIRSTPPTIATVHASGSILARSGRTTARIPAAATRQTLYRAAAARYARRQATPREVPMADEKARVLVVANRTAGSEVLLDALRERAARGPAHFHLVVPSTPHGVSWAADMHSGGDAAEHDLDGALERLHSAGLEADGEVGDPDPVAAVQDAA